MENHINAEEIAALDKLLHSYIEAYMMTLRPVDDFYFPRFFGYGMAKPAFSEMANEAGVANALVWNRYNRLVIDLIKNLPIDQQLISEIINKHSKDALPQLMPNLSVNFAEPEYFSDFLNLISGQVEQD